MDYKGHHIQQKHKEKILEVKQYHMLKVRDEKFYRAKEKFKAPPYGMRK